MYAGIPKTIIATYMKQSSHKWCRVNSILPTLLALRKQVESLREAPEPENSELVGFSLIHPETVFDMRIVQRQVTV